MQGHQEYLVIRDTISTDCTAKQMHFILPEEWCDAGQKVAPRGFDAIEEENTLLPNRCSDILATCRNFQSKDYYHGQSHLGLVAVWVLNWSIIRINEAHRRGDPANDCSYSSPVFLPDLSFIYMLT